MARRSRTIDLRHTFCCKIACVVEAINRSSACCSHCTDTLQTLVRGKSSYRSSFSYYLEFCLHTLVSTPVFLYLATAVFPLLMYLEILKCKPVYRLDARIVIYHVSKRECVIFWILEDVCSSAHFVCTGSFICMCWFMVQTGSSSSLR